MAQLNEAGLTIIRQSEGLRLDAYQDPAGIWTIGYGHTAGVQPGQHITQDQAESFLKQDLSGAEQAIQASVKSPLSDNQYSALVSFVFNIGSGQFQSSTLLRLLNQSDFQGAAEQFLQWTHAGGQVLPGLVTRRQAERALFLEPQGPLRLFAPPEQYLTAWTLQSDREHQLIAWIAGQLGLRYTDHSADGKLFLGLPLATPKIVPLQQSNAVACGQTCVAMCVNAFTGQHLTDVDINARYGFSLLQALNDECKTSDYTWIDGGNLTVDTWPEISGALQSGLPVILGLNGPEFSPSGRGHIITALQGDQVSFADPATGTTRTTTKASLLAAPPHPDGKFIFYPRRTNTS